MPPIGVGVGVGVTGVTFDVRPATVADAAAVAGLVDAAYGHYVARIGRLPSPMRDDYAAVIASRPVTVATVDGHLAGVLILARTDAGLCLENIAVHPRHQGAGLGGRLLALAEEAAVSAGYDSIYLYTHELMTENIGRYQRLGYVEYDRRTEVGLSRVFLRKPLSIAARLRAAGCVFAEDEAALLSEVAPHELDAMITRRIAGEPLEYILGWASFCGLRVSVEPGVFVPRRRTEFLVSSAARFVRPGAVVVDLCCGAGAIGVALMQTGVELHASDIDSVAVECARRNLPGVPVYQGDLFEALPTALRGRVDLVVANVPYVPTDAIALLPPEAREHEPRTALDGGTDGLDVLRQVAASAPRWLARGGHLLIETSEEQAPLAVAAFSAAGLQAAVVADDEVGATVVIGHLPIVQPQ